MDSNTIQLKLKQLIGFYMETLSEIGDTPISFKTKEVIDITPKEPVNHKDAQAQHEEALPKAALPKEGVQHLKERLPQPNFVVSSNNVDLSMVNTIGELKKKVCDTQVCELQKFATNIVFGDGTPNAKILVIGEAPGQDEDEKGIPFCGRSGQLLMNAFASIGLARENNIFITNNIFWRPPGNRKPTEEELSACRPYVEKIVKIIQPKVIICVGAVASQNILQTRESISNLRGKMIECTFGIETKAFCVYHPSYLLRSPSKKYNMYKDLLTLLPSISHFL